MEYRRLGPFFSGAALGAVRCDSPVTWGGTVRRCGSLLRWPGGWCPEAEGHDMPPLDRWLATSHERLLADIARVLDTDANRRATKQYLEGAPWRDRS